MVVCESSRPDKERLDRSTPFPKPRQPTLVQGIGDDPTATPRIDIAPFQRTILRLGCLMCGKGLVDDRSVHFLKQKLRHYRRRAASGADPGSGTRTVVLRNRPVEFRTILDLPKVVVASIIQLSRDTISHK